MDIADAELVDLKQRLRNTRWATEWPTAPWEAGTDAAELRRLVEYWADGYDWRANEAVINALPWHAADIAGIGVSYLRYDGEHPDSLPIVLTNGWPSSVLELADLFCGQARRRADRLFAELWANDDHAQYEVAQQLLSGRYAWFEDDVLDPAGGGPMMPTHVEPTVEHAEDPQATVAAAGTPMEEATVAQ